MSDFHLVRGNTPQETVKQDKNHQNKTNVQLYENAVGSGTFLGFK